VSARKPRDAPQRAWRAAAPCLRASNLSVELLGDAGRHARSTIGVAELPLDEVEALIAHRGLHDPAAGIIENTLEAARAAIARGFAIECDIQLSRDGEIFVFHDDALDRLTLAQGRFAELTAPQLRALPFRGASTKIPLLRELLDEIAGRVPLIVELKSGFDGDPRLAEAVFEMLRGHSGPVALKSFDPQLIAHLRGLRCALPLGIVAEADYSNAEWDILSPRQRQTLVHFLHLTETQPDFLSWHVGDLPHAVPFLCRAGMNMPVMVWTVRTPNDRQKARLWADQMIFETPALVPDNEAQQ
jgi:glycerophosphoryl diester phosphodiesterase